MAVRKFPTEIKRIPAPKTTDSDEAFLRLGIPDGRRCDGSYPDKAYAWPVGGEIPHNNKFGKVMHEYKEGTLHSGSKHGPKVTSRAQAKAIAASEAEKAGEYKRKKKS